MVLTALEADEEIAKAFEAGADDFVRKPFKPVELVARIRGQLRLRGVVEALAKNEQDGSLVLELTQALASNLDFRGILFTVVQRIAEVAKVDRVSIVLVREEGDVGYVVAASDDEHAARSAHRSSRSTPRSSRCSRAASRSSSPTCATHPLLEIVRQEGHCGRLQLPGDSAHPLRGAPHGRAVPPRAARVQFGDRELALCRTVSNAMAIALRNARVMQSLRDQTQQVTVARFEAERRLRTLQRYADFFESAADGIIVIDAEGHLLFSNPRARDNHRLQRGRPPRPQVGDFFSIRGREDRAHELRVGFRKGLYPQNVDVRIRRKNGETAILSVNFNSVLREEGVVLCTFRDVTAERAVEHELQKTKDFLQRIIDSSVDAIISADMKGTHPARQPAPPSASTASRPPSR